MTPALSPMELTQVARYVGQESGIVLDDSKGYLIQSRLRPLLDHVGVHSYGQLVLRAGADSSGALRSRIIDAISTGETSFFRDQRPFSLLVHKLVPDLLQRQKERGPADRLRLSIWSAACSTGQEVYSLAISLKELLFDLSRYWIKILGTDISEEVLALASKASYSDFELSRGISDVRRHRHFLHRDGRWQVTDELRALATFKPLNLTSRFNHVGLFDIIFCRNVAIYFSPENRRSLFTRVADQLRPGGALVIGSTESLVGLTQRFVRRQYQDAVYYERQP